MDVGAEVRDVGMTRAQRRRDGVRAERAVAELEDLAAGFGDAHAALGQHREQMPGPLGVLAQHRLRRDARAAVRRLDASRRLHRISHLRSSASMQRCWSSRVRACSATKASP